MPSESDEMDLETGRVMQKTVNEFFGGNAVEYIHRLWEWAAGIRELWEPVAQFHWKDEYDGKYSFIRNSKNPKGLSFARSKEVFPNSLVLVTQFYLYKQISQDLPHAKVPALINCLDIGNSRRFWRIVRKEEANEDPLEVKIERYSKKRPAANQERGDMNVKKFNNAIAGLAYDYLFRAAFRQLYVEYTAKGLHEKLEFLIEKYELPK